MLVNKDAYQRETLTKWSVLLPLRVLSESLRLGVAMFGATFNLVTRVGLPLFLEHWKMVVWKLIVQH